MNLRKKKEKEMSGRAGSTFKESAEIFPFFLNSFIRLLGFFLFYLLGFFLLSRNFGFRAGSRPSKRPRVSPTTVKLGTKLGVVAIVVVVVDVVDVVVGRWRFLRSLAGG